jgi:transcriptional regulator with XRE-family HTH domain
MTDNFTASIFQANLRRLREAKNWSQSVLAEKAEISVGSVKMWETGQRWPRPEHFDSLASALGCSPFDLIADPDTAMASALQRRHDEAPTFVDAISVLEAFRTAGPRRRAVALAVLTGDEAYLAAFPELAAQGIEALSAGPK